MAFLDRITKLFNRTAGVSKIDGVFGKFKAMISELNGGIALCAEQRKKNSAEMVRLSAENSLLARNESKAETLKNELEKLLAGSR